MHRFKDRFAFLCAESMGNGHTRANRQSDKEVDQQVYERTGCSHRRNRQASAEISHHYKVGGIEKKLQYAGQHDGNGV